jgi:hypothetical protein
VHVDEVEVGMLLKSLIPPVAEKGVMSAPKKRATRENRGSTGRQ